MSMRLQIPEDEVEISAVRSAGAGGQNVNKVSSAVHLRFDITASSLPGAVKARLLALRDQRITREGVVVIKARQHRSRDLNLGEAMRRLHQLVNSVATPPKPRRPTRPTRASKTRRIESKIRRSRIKALRGRVHLT
jgi:ribosome-associated protein